MFHQQPIELYQNTAVNYYLRDRKEIDAIEVITSAGVLKRGLPFSTLPSDLQVCKALVRLGKVRLLSLVLTGFDVRNMSVIEGSQ